MASLLLLLIFEVVFTELDELGVLTVLHDMLQLLLGILLEGISIEQ